jgi:hypothetical protein
MNILTHKEIIQSLLEDKPLLRDDDNKLLAHVWGKFLRQQGKHPQNISGYELLKVIGKGALPATESVVRCRRKLQEEVPALRGKLWGGRHKEQGNVIKQVREMET